MRRAVATALSSALLLAASVVPAVAGLTPNATASASPAAWRAAVADLLQRRARAIFDGDLDALASTMRGAPKAFRLRTTQSARRLRALGLRTYSLALADDGYLDLAAGLRHRPRADEVHVVQATERIALAGIDARGSADPVFLTVIRRNDVWSVVADDELVVLGLLPLVNAWDLAPVHRLRRDGVTVLYHSGATTASRLLNAMIAARKRVDDSWPYDWPQRIVLIVPRSTSELGAILQTTFDLGPFVAFAAASVDRAEGAFALGANRVYVQPNTYFSYSQGFRDDTLSHELTHVATRPLASAFTPAWLDEGVAQDYGERRIPSTPVLARMVRSSAFDGHLPADHDFILGGHDSIHLAYEKSSSFIAYLQRRAGRDAGARLYRELGREKPDSFGTAAYHLDRAARRAFGVSFDALERAWAADVRARL